jgi:hypothetical protein
VFGTFFGDLKKGFKVTWEATATILENASLAPLFRGMLIVITFAVNKRSQMVDKRHTTLVVKTATERMGSFKYYHIHHPWNFFLWPQYNSVSLHV